MKLRIGNASFPLLLCGALLLGFRAQAQTQDLPLPQAQAQAQAQDLPLPQGQAQDLPQAKAQEPGSQPPEPELKANPLDALRNFEPAENEEYRLGKGDEIEVDFAGRPDLTAKLVIGPDGRITLPLAGEVMLDGLTRQGAAQAIASALSSYYSNLAVQVTVTKYTANRVLLLGAVEHPGVFTFDGTPTLLEVLARGGMETSTSAAPNVGASTQANKVSQIPERCAIYRGNNQVLWVELKALIESGNALADLRLRRDDVVYVPNMAERFVSVLGEVQHPGAIPLTNTSTLASVLAEAGGLTAQAGHNPHIQIVDPAKGTTRVVTLKDILNPVRSLEATLRPGEIVFVPTSGFNRATYVLERINPMTSLATMAVLVGY